MAPEGLPQVLVYKRSRLEATRRWKRADLYEVVTFAPHLGCRNAAIIDFGNREQRRPRIGVGGTAGKVIWVEHFRWPIDIVDPAEAESRFAADVQRWLELGTRT